MEFVIGVMGVQEDLLAGDKATDVWACGTVLFAMLTAHPPSHTSGTQERTSGASSEAAGEEEVAGQLVWPDNVQVSDSCKNLLEVMLSPHSAERPTIHQVLDHPWCVLPAPQLCLQCALLAAAVGFCQSKTATKATPF